jgi:hypothetical protein
MGHLKIFKREFGQQVFLSLQMLKRHHFLLIDRDGEKYLGLVRPVTDCPGDVLIVIPDPRWPEAVPGRVTRVPPERALAYEVRLASEDEQAEHLRALVDQLYP